MEANERQTESDEEVLREVLALEDKIEEDERGNFIEIEPASPKRTREEESASTSASTSGGGGESNEEMEAPFEFELRGHVDRRVRRFGLHIRNFTGRLIQTGGGAAVGSAPLGPRPVLVQQIARALQRAVQRHILDDGAVGDDDHLLININSNRIQNAFHSRRLRVGEWRENAVAAQQVLKQISDMLNSNQTFQVDDTFNLNVSHVQDPGRGGDNQKHKPGLDPIEQILDRKRCVFKIKNTDQLCCARALVMMKARADFGTDHWYYSNLRKYDTVQERAARELHRLSDVPEGPCGLDELAKFQAHLNAYQIVVVSVQHGYQIIFKGAQRPDDKRLILIKHHDHYHGCTSLGGFFGKSYYCTQCEKGFSHDNRKEHRCPGARCAACHQTDCHEWKRAHAVPRVNCADCQRDFFGTRCLQLHKSRTDTGKDMTRDKRNSVCDKHKRCAGCFKTYGDYELRNSHKCGHAQCPSCKEYQDLRYHQCYIQNPLKVEQKQNRKRTSAGQRKEDDPPVFVSWDAEARQEEGQHVANLICALRGDTDERRTFEGETCVKDFLAWLREIAEQQRVIAVAHNFQGYDSYFILNELYDQAICPEQVVNGAKIISMTIPNITFKDSMCFLQMSLATFPKAFGLTEQKKGFFPHFFNTQENQNYVGSMPARDYYDPEGMSTARKAEFDKWYEERVAENYEFHFRNELVDYCRSDVELLHEGCKVFRAEFQAIAGFDPMDQCLTIASACNRFYRTKCMQEQTLASEPVRGWQGKGKPHSHVSLEWLLYQDTQTQGTIRHARNGGERALWIGGRLINVDGYEDRTVYEFHGCYFHGCPDCFPNRDQKHRKMGDRSLRDVYAETQQKTQRIRAAGYRVVEMWECQWKALKDSDPEVKSFVDSLAINSRLEPRDAFFGGRTNAVRLYDLAEPEEEIRYVDFTSLYPWVNKNCDYPQGHPEVILEPGHTNISQFFGLAKCTVTPPYGLYSPVLPYRQGGKLTFPLCRTCVEVEQPKPLTQRSSKCAHSPQERQLTGTWCTPELEEAVKQGYVVEHIHEVWHFDRKSNTMFKEYVNTFLKMKQEASGWPSWVGDDPDKRQEYLRQFFLKEGIQLDPDKIEKNPGRRSLAKIMLNSFWGKYGQRGNKTQVEAFTSAAEFHDLLRDETRDIHDIRVVNPDMLEVVHKCKEDCANIQPDINIFIACLTTTWARLKLYQEGLSILQPEQILYFDTDSLIYKHREGQPSLPLGDYLGDFTNELDDDDFIVEFAAAGPKNYAYKTKLGKTCCKVRGFSLNVRGSAHLNFETLKDNVKSEVKEPLAETRSIALFNPHKITRDKTTKTLNTVTEIKRYQVVFDKRVVDANTFMSYPYGYCKA
ncbi:hypothetical protein ACROYT_G033681 [Oculina patagonica]